MIAGLPIPISDFRARNMAGKRSSHKQSPPCPRGRYEKLHLRLGRCEVSTKIRFSCFVIPVLTFLIVPATFAQAPANDDILSATVISSLPFSDNLSTSDATWAADDPIICTNNVPTVWYQYSPETDMHVEFNTYGSDYDTTLSVYSGAPSELTPISCNDDWNGTAQSRLSIDVVVGETYYLMVGAFASADPPEGNLIFTAQEIQEGPPLTMDVVVNPVGTVVPSTGIATIQGTVTCNRQAFFVILGELAQKRGHSTIVGTGSSLAFPCDSNGPTAWTFSLPGDAGGRFVGGPSSFSAYFSGVTLDFTSFVDVPTNTLIRLRGERR